MTDADDDARLKAMFRADAPPAMDARFRLEALERIERRSACGKLALVFAAGAAATAGVAMLGPQLSLDLHGAPMIVVGLLIAGVATGWGVMQMRRPI